MKREEQFRRNHTLFEIFMLEALHNPGLTEQLTGDTHVVFLPENDPELTEANLALAREKAMQGVPVVFVRVRLVPEVRTVFVPRMSVEFAMAA